MQRASTTVIVLVGAQASQGSAALGQAANVRAVMPPADEPPLERARQMLVAAAGTSSPFLVGDADPLVDVTDAWVRWYDGDGVRGELETAIAAVLARWRAGTLALPDYYLLLDAQDWPTTRRHWFLGWLHRHAPARIIPVEGTQVGLITAVSRLRAGRWWPPLDVLLAGADKVTPDEFVTVDDAGGEPLRPSRLARPGSARQPDRSVTEVPDTPGERP